jgi:RNA polymerase sigma-70 factor (ECF subfamily)
MTACAGTLRDSAPAVAGVAEPRRVTFVLAFCQGVAPQAIAVAQPLTSCGMQEPTTDPLGANLMRDQQLAELLLAASHGDARAFESFYNATARYALTLVRRIVGEAHAEDVLSDCYFMAWRNADQFDSGRGSPLAWLLTMARSRALDRLRQENVRHAGLGGAPEFDPDEGEAHPGPGPEQLLEAVETSSRLHAALAQLSATERWVLGLAFYRDCSHSEIAELTGMPLGTVKSLVTRAQHKLRETLQDLAGHEPTGTRH